MEFLKNQGIAGVSHHSLLFSKTAPVQDAPEDDQVSRYQVTTTQVYDGFFPRPIWFFRPRCHNLIFTSWIMDHVIFNMGELYFGIVFFLDDCISVKSLINC